MQTHMAPTCCFAGTRSIQMLYRAVLFTFAPTFVELVFVVGLLANRFSPMVAVLVGCTFALYVAWTLSMTQVRFVEVFYSITRAAYFMF